LTTPPAALVVEPSLPERLPIVATLSTLVVTAEDPDLVLYAEAERLGATFALKSATQAELRAAICRILFKAHGSTEPIRAPFERRAQGRRIALATAHKPECRVRERRRDVVKAIQELSTTPISLASGAMR
jgi:hypothetical protein